MAKVKLNPTFEAIRGKVGDLVYKRFAGEEIVSRVPDRTGIVATPNQIAQQDKFRLAVIYGKAVLADPETKELYDDVAARRGEPVFALAVGDFLNTPAVHEIDLANYSGQTGEVIRIRASDDVEVKGVTVAIRNQVGAVLEEGPATWTASSGSWAYTTTTTIAQGQSISIEVSATDRPGHKTIKVQAQS